MRTTLLLCLLAPFLIGQGFAQTPGFQITALPTGRGYGTCEIQMRLTNHFPQFDLLQGLSMQVEVNNGGRSVARYVSFRAVERWRARDETLIVDGVCDPRLTIRIMSVERCEIDRRVYSDCADFLKPMEPVSLRSGLASPPPAPATPVPVQAVVRSVTVDSEGYAIARLELSVPARSGSSMLLFDCKFRDASGGEVGQYYAARSISFVDGHASLEIRSTHPGAATRADCGVR